MNFETVIDCFNNAKNSIDGRYTFSHITEYGLLKTIHFVIERTHLENEYFNIKIINIIFECLNENNLYYNNILITYDYKKIYDYTFFINTANKFLNIN